MRDRIVPFIYVDLLNTTVAYIVILHFFSPSLITVICSSQLKYEAYGTSAIWVTMLSFNESYCFLSNQTWLIPAYFTNGTPLTFSVPVIYLTREFNSSFFLHSVATISLPPLDSRCFLRGYTVAPSAKKKS